MPLAAGVALLCAILATQSNGAASMRTRKGDWWGEGQLGRCPPKETVNVTEWFQRTGNNIAQIVHATTFARWGGATLVALPLEEGPISELFELPPVLDAVSRQPEVQGGFGQVASEQTFRCNCTWEGLYYMDNPCTPANPGLGVQAWNAVRYDVVQNLIWPHLRPQFAQCAAADLEVLTIHGRYGDLGAFQAHDNHTQAMLYPCAFYEHLIDEHGFKHVVFVTEETVDEVGVRWEQNPSGTWYKGTATEPHPCIEVLQQRQDIEFRLVTALEDSVCAITKATNLVLGRSSFSLSLLYGNSVVSRVFVGDEGGLGWRGSVTPEVQSFVAEDCYPGTPVVHRYDIEGYPVIYVGQDKLDYMLNPQLSVKHSTKECMV